MVNFGTNTKDECMRLQELAEACAAERPELRSVDELSGALPAAERGHLARCANCREALGDLMEALELFRGVASQAQAERPWFSTRVMAAIAAKERELAEVTKTWMAVPRFAVRVAVASAALLVVTTTWLYERPRPAVNPQNASLEAQESLFEATQANHQDDVLVPMQEPAHE